MDGDEEAEIFSYTPLKREKIGENISTFGSQPRKRKCKMNLSVSSQCHHRSLSRQCMKSKVKSIGNQKNSIDEKSTDLSRNNIKRIKGNNNLSSVKSRAKSPSEGLSCIKPKEKIPKNDQSRLRNCFQLDSSSDNSKLSINDSSGFEEIPDLDFSLPGKSSKTLTTINIKSSDDDESESFLEERPKDLLVLENYDNSDAKTDIFIQSSPLISEQKGKNCHQNNAKTSISLKAPNSFKNVEKVDSWLRKSLDFLTPQKVEIVDDSDEWGECPQSSKGNEGENLPGSDVVQNSVPKTCVHLHFHVNSPKKFIQPTLEKFFKSSSENQEGIERNEANTGSSNPQDVVRTWGKLMNAMRGGASQEPSTSVPRMNERKKPWNKANCTENAFSQANSSWSRNGKKMCPFYKYVEGTSFVVDAFSYGVINGVSAYFLSHFHYDHYRGLSKNFTKPIYCSKITGKERVFKAVASELNSKIFAPTPKSNVLLQLEDEEISERLTKHKLEAQVHVVSMSELTPFKLKKYMDTVFPTFNVLVAIKPTGWTHSNLSGDCLENLRPQQMGNVYLYGLPYSEHSSFCELKRFVQFVEARKIIPTVNNGNSSTRMKMEAIFAKWQMNRRTSKS